MEAALTRAEAVSLALRHHASPRGKAPLERRIRRPAPQHSKHHHQLLTSPRSKAAPTQATLRQASTLRNQARTHATRIRCRWCTAAAARAMRIDSFPTTTTTSISTSGDGQGVLCNEAILQPPQPCCTKPGTSARKSSTRSSTFAFVSVSVSVSVCLCISAEGSSQRETLCLRAQPRRDGRCRARCCIWGGRTWK